MRDIIISPEEYIGVRSRVTHIGYKVYKILISDGKVKKYLIKNNGCFEWWNSSRFIILQPNSNSYTGLCERCHKRRIAYYD